METLHGKVNLSSGDTEMTSTELYVLVFEYILSFEFLACFLANLLTIVVCEAVSNVHIMCSYFTL